MDADYTKAKGYALRLFKLRPQSTGELTDKMCRKGFPTDIIERVSADMKAWGYLDDEAFTRAWLQGRIKKHGYRRITLELRDKGIPKEMVSSVWEQVKDEYDEAAVVREIAMRRARICKDLPQLKRRKRITDYLARRGFNLGVISKVLRDL